MPTFTCKNGATQALRCGLAMAAFHGTNEQGKGKNTTLCQSSHIEGRGHSYPIGKGQI